jgi:hypothetical protein
LNCHNVAKHCKFDQRDNVVPNNDTASAPAVNIKMVTFTGAESARCVYWFEETESATQVKRKFRTQYSKEPPSRPTIYSWHKNFVETGYLPTNVVEQRTLITAAVAEVSQRCYMACGKILATGGMSAALPMGVTKLN